jgi:hypothetical protein
MEHETRRLAMNSGRTPIDDIRDRLDAERIVDIIYDYDAKIVLDVMSVARTIDLVYRVWREAITEHGRVYDREFQFREFNDLLDALKFAAMEEDHYHKVKRGGQ